MGARQPQRDEVRRAAIRDGIANNESYASIGRRLGISRERVSQLARGMGHFRCPQRRRLFLVPMDPAEAARRTAAKQAYWSNLERSA